MHPKINQYPLTEQVAATPEFAAFQARIRASERLICERDLYDRACRWSVDGRHDERRPS